VFAFFTSPEKKARHGAVRLLELARTIWNYQRDLLTPADAAELSRRRAELQGLVRGKAPAAKLEPAVRALEAVLGKTGGAIYPRSSLAENVDFFLVALILIIGVRSYFLQPMVIPTNSMWPTYFGMTAETFPPDGPAPGLLARVARLAAFGAVRHETDAPVAGEVSALFGLDATGQPRLVASLVDGRSWFVLPAKFAEYTLFVNDVPVQVRVPEDFHDLDQVIVDTYFHGRGDFANQWRQAQAEGRIRELSASGSSGQSYRVFQMPLGKSVNAGDPLVRFDLLKGDMLFVDRFSYHFFRPKVGSAFVFETENIPLYASNTGSDEFLIKRLVGAPGDTLEIREPVLYRNGKPIEGAGAFDGNARRAGLYRGYFNAPENGGRYLLPGQSATVPPHFFMGLGDNSPISEDGRYWGFVPEKDVIGRPIFIYYPFTRRWGLAK
jgi:signal peptidase I